MVVTAEEYYTRVYIDRHNHYWVADNKNEYLGYLPTIEEALYYRDLFQNQKNKKEIPKPNQLDLRKNNPYLEKGLQYPIPERLQKNKKRKTRTRGQGSITKNSKSSYAITYCGEYYCSCRTYEQAYYVRKELQKCNWDTSKLEEILEEYPKYYTKLLYFYHYITRDKKNGDYILAPPKRFTNQKQTHIRYKNLEDALFERDFLINHDWDYEILVECIDDNKNPYYDMELPPYPQRKIRNIRKHPSHKQELYLLAEIIKEDPEIPQRKAAQLLGTSDMNIRNWLKNYNTNWMDFKTLAINESNPVDHLELGGLTYTPDLTPEKPVNFNGYIYIDNNRKSKYRVTKKKKDYGSYPTRKLAEKIVKDLIKCNWDKSKLPMIQEKHGHKPYHNRGYIYKHPYGSYTIRKKNKAGRMISYGTYPDYEYATILRDLLKHNQWDKSKLPEYREKATLIQDYKKNYYNNMFNGERL